MGATEPRQAANPRYQPGPPAPRSARGQRAMRRPWPGCGSTRSIKRMAAGVVVNRLADLAGNGAPAPGCVPVTGGRDRGACGVTPLEPYFSDGKVRLYLGDCEDVMAAMPDESVDVAVTSPPYNMGLSPGGNGRGMYRPGASNKAGRFRDGYGGHGDAMPYGEYCAWQRRVLAECWRVTRFGVSYCHRPRVEHGTLRMPLDFDFGGLPVRQVIAWDRGTGIDVNLRNFCTRQEWIILLAKPGFRPASHAASGMGDVWRLGMETKVPWHPAPFPVSPPARCIEPTGARSVLDPFAGPGSTLPAARNAGIAGTGAENREPYCELAVRRFRGERRTRDGSVQMALDGAA